MWALRFVGIKVSERSLYSIFFSLPFRIECTIIFDEFSGIFILKKTEKQRKNEKMFNGHDKITKDFRSTRKITKKLFLDWIVSQFNDKISCFFMKFEIPASNLNLFYLYTNARPIWMGNIVQKMGNIVHIIGRKLHLNP